MSDPPPLALRTYTAIRVGVVAVIAGLGFAVWREIANSPGHCVQRSLSAYYYTPVRPVFVGALLIIGFAMIVMWGMTWLEDAALNLAGLLLMVVALVPTLDANYCSIDIKAKVPNAETKQIADNALIKANADTVSRSFTSLLFVLALVLVIVAAFGVKEYRRVLQVRRLSRTEIGYAVAWVTVALVGFIYYLLYRDHDNPDSAFNHEVHSKSANIAVGLIILAAVLAAVQKARSTDAAKTRWTRIYGLVALAMLLAAGVIRVGDHFDLFSGWVDDHATFLLEAILIALIGVFWTLQTIDRRGEGAPRYDGLLGAEPPQTTEAQPSAP
jgi:hypothetical protein